MEGKIELGYIGLGKMGANMVERLLQEGYRVVASNRSREAIERIVTKGAVGAFSYKELVEKLEAPRLIWLMVPNQAVASVLEELLPLLDKGDTVIDGGNSRYTETKERAEMIASMGMNFMDAGVSGGPDGAAQGACLMIGGDRAVYEKYETLFQDIAAPESYGYFGKSGAGHFVKMVHNGIEYGMMQAIAEGFEILKKSEFNLDLKQVAGIYNNRSVIESRLIGWLKAGFERYGTSLDDISGSVGHTGEGLWTIETARELGIPTPIIEGALKFREDSESHPSYSGKILSVMRNMFGGHEVVNNMESKIK